MNYNVLPLRDIVIYPHSITPLFIGRKKSVESINLALNAKMQIVLVTQKKSDIENPTVSDVYSVGTLANITQVLSLSDGTLKVLVEGIRRVKISELNEDVSLCDCTDMPMIIPTMIDKEESLTVLNTLKTSFRLYIEERRKEVKDILAGIEVVTDLSVLTDMIASHLDVNINDKIALLKESDPTRRATSILTLIEKEQDLMALEKRIRSRVKSQMDRNQKEYYLNEQAKAIQKELDELDGGKSELGLLEKKITDANMPKDIEERCLQELEKLKKMPSISSEATVLRNYLDVVISYPWQNETEDTTGLEGAESVLNTTHYGLEDVKKRIIEFIAVQQRTKETSGSILCLVGPPGVGKTSIGKSIAKATNRNYIRMALGGVRDEAEIRGHRRTYIGAMPGRIVQNIIKSGSSNPLFLLDEIDKMASDYRGDPASAMLEVLDPEQNVKFSDHYMEIDIDLSKVMFVATANSLDIPGPLLDRMEIIRIPGYTESEKLMIAKTYLLPENIRKTGLDPKEIDFSDAAIKRIIESYTREAGVRKLDQQIAKACRQALMSILLGKADKILIDSDNLSDFLGVEKYHHDSIAQEAKPGLVNGLAWTSVGGELLKIEVAITPGKGRVLETGKLGDVMKESIHAAMTVVKMYANQIGISYQFFQEHDIHIHLPEGAVPKDGPSAGTALATAILSAIIDEPVQKTIAMTGELTLQGNILAIGGLKEKLFAAARENVNTVFIPKDNEKDLAEIPSEIKDKLLINTVSDINNIFSYTFSSVLKTIDKNKESVPFYQKYLENKEIGLQKH